MIKFPDDPDFTFYDGTERALISSTELHALEGQEETALYQALQRSARNHLKKDMRINIRLSSHDVSLLRMRAAEEGMSYQTLISSILHKYATGRFDS